MLREPLEEGLDLPVEFAEFDKAHRQKLDPATVRAYLAFALVAGDTSLTLPVVTRLHALRRSSITVVYTRTLRSIRRVLSTSEHSHKSLLILSITCCS